MKNSKTLLNDVVRRLKLKENADEVKTIASMLLENIFGLSPTDIMAGKVVNDTPDKEQLIEQYVERLNRHEPVQYVLGQAFFCGRAFKVTPSVLIPRPETEDLVRTVLEWKRTQGRARTHPKMLDIGTGSGCIPVTLFLECPGAELFASDISADALAVARQNAEAHSAKVSFLEHDILTEEISLADLDVIVSNPPYIAENEQGTMMPNVLKFEPWIALFVPDNDPLRFYKTIASKAKGAMVPGGLLAFEVNEKFGHQVCELLIENGWKTVQLIRDISGKHRVVTATR